MLSFGTQSLNEGRVNLATVPNSKLFPNSNRQNRQSSQNRQRTVKTDQNRLKKQNNQNRAKNSTPAAYTAPLHLQHSRLNRTQERGKEKVCSWNIYLSSHKGHSETVINMALLIYDCLFVCQANIVLQLRIVGNVISQYLWCSQSKSF